MEKEFRKLSRRELVDVIYQMKKNEQHLEERIATLETALEEKRIHIAAAGTIADAAAEITQLFSSAQATADLYLHEIACMKAETEEECARIIAEAKKKSSEETNNGE